jgi:hypothetical protein
MMRVGRAPSPRSRVFGNIKASILFSSLVLAASSCSPEVGDIGSDAIGVFVKNDCDREIHAHASERGDFARAELRTVGLRIQPGESPNVSIIAFSGYQPKKYFLAVGIDPASPIVAEYDVKRIDKTPTFVVFGADCASITDAGNT